MHAQLLTAASGLSHAPCACCQLEYRLDSSRLHARLSDKNGVCIFYYVKFVCTVIFSSVPKGKLPGSRSRDNLLVVLRVGFVNL